MIIACLEPFFFLLCVSHQGAERSPWPSRHHLLFCYLKHAFWAVGLESPSYVWRPKHDHISQSINFLGNGLLGLHVYFHPSGSQGILLCRLSYTFAGSYIQPWEYSPFTHQNVSACSQYSQPSNCVCLLSLTIGQTVQDTAWNLVFGLTSLSWYATITG